MLKIKVISDLHLEFAPINVPYNGEDILVLAGDISPSVDSVFSFIEEYMTTNTNTQILLILGNHDYFGSNIFERINYYRDNCSAIDRLHFLQDSSVVISGYRFCGATMWTDMMNGDTQSMKHCGRYTNDFYNIVDFDPFMFCSLHENSKNALAREIKNSEQPVVVITHHLPSFKSIDPAFNGNKTNAAFASTDMNNLIASEKVKLWCHGHTHKTLDYMDGDTRVVCNPRGYVKNVRGVLKVENLKFNPEFIIGLV